MKNINKIDISDLVFKGEKLKMVILSYLEVESIKDNIAEFFTLGYYLKECYECIDKLVDNLNEYIERVNTFDDEFKLNEVYGIALNKVESATRLLNSLENVKAVAKDTNGFKEVEDALVTDIYSSLILAYREVALLDFE
ncbi:MAG: hypothetical protein IJE45_01460 [Bacilli bacterium]|nr:hypothetical protein [Bacilli bacterium]